MVSLRVRGEMQEPFKWLLGVSQCPLETLMEGPGGTGKTHNALQFVRAYLDNFPGSTFVIMREIRADMPETVLAEWEDFVLGRQHPAVMNGPTRENREMYQMPNGSRALVRGYDKPGKLFSGQIHGLYFCESWQTTEDKWQQLHRAVRGSFEGIKSLNGTKPFRPLIADTNPQEEEHWLNNRAEPRPDKGNYKGRGQMKRLVTHLEDNPRWHTGIDWTEDGADYRNRLQAGLTGHQYQRLYLGVWTNAVGQVLADFDPAVHVVSGNWIGEKTLDVGGEIVEFRYFFGAHDVGIRNPGVFGAWGVDTQGRIWLVDEIYRTEWDSQEWADAIAPLHDRYSFVAIVSDHDESFIKILNRRLTGNGMSALVRNCDKRLGKSGKESKRMSIDLFATALRTRRIFFLKGACRVPDPALKQAGLVWCTAQELPGVRWSEYERGKDKVDSADDIDGRFPDHGFDMTRYALAFALKDAITSGRDDGLSGRHGIAKELYEDRKRILTRANGGIQRKSYGGIEVLG